MLELGPLLDRKPKQLSGGQRQRVAMGRAIVREPQVFLMDEPLSNLDAKLRVQMRAEIAQVQRDLNVTTIYVTHDQTEAMTMGDRVALMKAGVLQQLGSPQHLYDHPDNIFVAGFIGSPPMNMAVARVEQRAAAAYTLRLGGAVLRAARRRRSRERPALAWYVGRDSRSASAARTWRTPRWPADTSPDARLRAKVSLTEALGSEIVVHFNVDAPRVVTADTKALEKDAHTEDVPVAHHGQHVRRVVRPAVPGPARRRDRDRRRPRAAALLRPRDRPGDPRLTVRGDETVTEPAVGARHGPARAAARTWSCGTPSGPATR